VLRIRCQEILMEARRYYIKDADGETVWEGTTGDGLHCVLRAGTYRFGVIVTTETEMTFDRDFVAQQISTYEPGATMLLQFPAEE
jgi:hypothetical protein